MTTMELRGTGASLAWKAYRTNAIGLGTSTEREYANSIPAPAKLLLLLPEAQQPIRHGLSIKTVQGARHAGTEAYAALLLSDPTPSVRATRNIMYMHCRQHMRRAGSASRLLKRAQLVAGEGSLCATAPACRTWYSTLALLSNGFTADIELFTADVPMPGEPIPARSHDIQFSWSATTTHAEHVTFVRKALKMQTARRTVRSVAFTSELQRLIYRLDAPPTDAADGALASAPADPPVNTPSDSPADAPADAPNGAPSRAKRKRGRGLSMCDLSGYDAVPEPDARLPPGWFHVSKERPDGRKHSRYVAPNGLSTDRMSVVLNADA